MWRGVRPDTAPVYRELRELLSRSVPLGAADSTIVVR